MVSRAKNKFQLIDAIQQYHKQQQGQIDQTNNKGTKIKNPSKGIKCKIKCRSNNEEIRVEKKNEDKVKNKTQERVENWKIRLN